MKGLLSTDRWTGRFAVLACIFVLPFLRFLLQNDYPLIRLEALAGAALLVIPCLLLALVCRPWLLFAAVVLAGILLMSATTVSHLVPGGLRLRWVLLGLLLVLIPAVVWMRENFFRLVLIFVTAAFAVDVLQAIIPRRHVAVAGLQKSAPAVSLPHVVYIIFDEHIGIDGLPQDIPECREARDGLLAVLSRHNFKVYPDAFSNYRNSMDSIPSLLNLELLERSQQFLHDAPEQNVLRTNRLFSRFRSQGYELAVYQSTYIDFCPPSFQCRQLTYKANSIGQIAPLAIPWADKFRHVVASYLQSDTFVLETVHALFPPARKIRARYVGPLGTHEVWPGPLAQRIVSARRKTLFFAHLLTPHYPYVYTREGRVRDFSDWGLDLGLRFSDPALYKLQYRRYAGQVLHLTAELDNFLNALKQTPSYSSSLIVFHGDHGSRLRLLESARLEASTDSNDRYDYLEEPNIRDLLNRFSALLAIKQPGIAPGRIVSRKTSVLRVLTELFEPEKAAKLTDAADRVYLFDADGKPAGIPMLKIWSN